MCTRFTTINRNSVEICWFWWKLSKFFVRSKFRTSGYRVDEMANDKD